MNERLFFGKDAKITNDKTPSRRGELVIGPGRLRPSNDDRRGADTGFASV